MVFSFPSNGQRNRKMMVSLAVLIILAALLAACGSPAPVLTPALESPPSPESQSPAPPSSAPSPTVESAEDTPDAAVPTGTSTIPAPTEPSPTRASPRLFADHIYGDGPVIEHGPPGSWDAAYIYPIGTIFFEGLYYQFRAGYAEGQSASGVGYSTSPDGFTWTRHDEPVFTELPVVGAPHAEPSLLFSSVLVNAAGEVELYMMANLPGSGDRAGIWRATAPHPDGPWQMHEQPVLLPGSPGEWDADGVLFPSVVFRPEGYRMAYEGSNLSAQTNGFGWATSQDGLSWTKYDNPDTIATPYAESDPVLVPDPESDWDSYRVGVPNLVVVPDGCLLAYYGQSRRNGPPAVGLASSPDGNAWERYHANPVFARNDLPGGAPMHLSDFYYDQNTAFLFVEGQSGGAADIWLAIFEGDLP